jgi:Fur family ferric uptake transcriptional regulator
MKQERHDVEERELRQLLRAAGLKCTAARLAVLARLRRASSPMTHGEMSVDLVPRGFDKATVFRNLTDLAEAGLLTRTELGDHVWRFEIRESQNSERGGHPHFVCVDCGTVTCLTDVEFDSATKRRAARVGRVTEILLKGHCVDCG